MKGKKQNQNEGVQEVASLQNLIASMVNEAIQKALENMNASTTKTKKSKQEKKAKKSKKQEKKLTLYEKIKESKKLRKFRLENLLTNARKLKALDIQASKDFGILQISAIVENNEGEEKHLSKKSFRNIYMDSDGLKQFIQILYSQLKYMEGKTKGKEFLKQLEKL